VEIEMEDRKIIAEKLRLAMHLVNQPKQTDFQLRLARALVQSVHTDLVAMLDMDLEKVSG